MIVGHKKQLDFLKRSLELDKLSHAYIFSGQEKLGKRTIALEWAGLINNHLFQEQYPDFILIQAQGNTILVSQIRELIWRLSLKPSLISYKIAIIDNAHLMGIDAQHALLKTLEEPKGKSILILITDHPQALFATIRSRCEIMKFYPVSKNEIDDYLKKQDIPQDKAEEISILSGGKPGEAIDLALNYNKLEERKKIAEELEKISSSLLYERFQYAKELSQKENLKEILEIWLGFLREKLIREIGEESTEEESEDSQRLREKLNLLQQFYILVSTSNVNAKLALETLFLNI